MPHAIPKVIVLFGTLLLGGCGAPPAPAVSVPAPYSDHGIRVSVGGLWRASDGDVLGVSGLAINASGKDLVVCQIYLDALDAAGVKVSSAVASTTGLKAGQTWRFQAPFLTPFSVQIRSIAPDQITVLAAR